MVKGGLEGFHVVVALSMPERRWPEDRGRKPRLACNFSRGTWPALEFNQLLTKTADPNHDRKACR